MNTRSLALLLASCAQICAQTALSTCDNTCGETDPSLWILAGDGECDDGGPGSQYTFCPLGTDCTDCTFCCDSYINGAAPGQSNYCQKSEGGSMKCYPPNGGDGASVAELDLAGCENNESPLCTNTTVDELQKMLDDCVINVALAHGLSLGRRARAAVEHLVAQLGSGGHRGATLDGRRSDFLDHSAIARG